MTTSDIKIADAGNKLIALVGVNGFALWIPEERDNNDYMTFLRYLADNNLTIDDTPEWEANDGININIKVQVQ